jgi:hypothetical protein
MNPSTFYCQDVRIAAGSSDCGMSAAKAESVTDVPVEQFGSRWSDLPPPRNGSVARALPTEDRRGQSKGPGQRELSDQLAQQEPTRSPSGVFEVARARERLPPAGARL